MSEPKTRYRVVPFVEGDQRTTFCDQEVAMPRYRAMPGCAWRLLVLLRLVHPRPLPSYTEAELLALARAYRMLPATMATFRRALQRLIAGGYLVPLADEEGAG